MLYFLKQIPFTVSILLLMPSSMTSLSLFTSAVALYIISFRFVVTNLGDQEAKVLDKESYSDHEW